MRRVLVDTNVLLDVLFDREPHVRASAAVWALVEKRLIQGFIAAHAVITIFYLGRRALGPAKATRAVSSLLELFDVAPVDRAVIEEALRLGFSDFEDAVTVAAAESTECDLLVTRDPKGFRGARIRVSMPEAALPLLEAGSDAG